MALCWNHIYAGKDWMLALHVRKRTLWHKKLLEMTFCIRSLHVFPWGWVGGVSDQYARPPATPFPPPPGRLYNLLPTQKYGRRKRRAPFLCWLGNGRKWNRNWQTPLSSVMVLPHLAPSGPGKITFLSILFTTSSYMFIQLVSVIGYYLEERKLEQQYK